MPNLRALPWRSQARLGHNTPGHGKPGSAVSCQAWRGLAWPSRTGTCLNWQGLAMPGLGAEPHVANDFERGTPRPWVLVVLAVLLAAMHLRLVARDRRGAN